MAVVARTQQGEVEGREKNGALLFAGIPYAAPPVGPRRFLPPEPHERWRGVRDAQRFGAAAPQLPGDGARSASRDVRWDEDCLTLNVCTPAADGARRPVLVWIHGGGFQTGQGAIPWYDGTSFARRGDVVTVTINYRLGALGFAHARRARRRGLRERGSQRHPRPDRGAALGARQHRGVRRRSRARHDRGRVGGRHERRRAARRRRRRAGLFRGAIAQSGAAQHVISRREGARGRRAASPTRSAPTASRSCARASVRGDPRRAAPPSRPRTSRRAAAIRPGSAACRSGRSSRAACCRSPPLESVRKGNAADVSVLTGTNADETTIWSVGEFDEDRARRAFGRYLPGAEARVRRLPRRAPGRAAGERSSWRSPPTSRSASRRCASPRRSTPPADACTSTSSRGGRARSAAGSVRRTRSRSRSCSTRSTQARRRRVPRARPAAAALADRMHAAWTAFVRDGDPACEALPAWPAYEPAGRVLLCTTVKRERGAQRTQQLFRPVPELALSETPPGSSSPPGG